MFIFTISFQDKLDHDNWETTYVLLLWLAALCLIPFDICSMDSSAGLMSVNGKSTLVLNIVQTCKSCMQDTGPTREAASVCLSVLLTRPDMETAHLHEFMTWSIALLDSWSQLPPAERSNLSSQYFLILGDLHCVFQIYKLGHRLKLLPYGPLLLPHCLRLIEGNSQTSTRKLLTKLIQRIGMNFLPPRVAAWRYLRGNRSLNLASSKPALAPPAAPAPLTRKPDEIPRNGGEGNVGEVAADEEEEDVPDEMEDVVDKLLTSLQDKDTVVRWSAAKGIGRITMRLTQDLAGDVVDAVIEAFADAEADSSWHGGCLALAELSRRGLLLPDRLAVVMPLIERAIRFDIMRGQHSIGAHVRDAACYVCWAFSRAYSPAVMAPFIRALTTALLTTALFDREVNCRRAASAAYQETVGRQGDQNVPNGITIITIADYFSVGNRLNCFTSIAASVAVLDPQLNESLMVHLATSTVRHWDRDMRELAAKALASLAPLNVNAAVEHLGRLAESCTAANLNLRHGSLLATAELLFALVAQSVQLPESLATSIIGIVASMDKGRLYSCKGSELMRAAVCILIRSVARARIPLPVKVQVAYVEALNEHLRQPHESVQFAARDSLREFLHTHFSAGDLPSERLQKLTVLKYLEGVLTSTNVSVTRGCALALGVVPARLLLLPEGRIDQVLDCLQQCGSSAHRIAGEYDADTCRHCIAALDEIAERLSPYPRSFSTNHVRRCFAIFLQASEDYSVDKRGDTGSWSRMAAMRGMERLLYSCLRAEGPDQTTTISAMTSVAVGATVSTSTGIAVVDKIVSRTDTQVVVEVRFATRSLGQSLYSSSPLQYMINVDTKYFSDSSAVVTAESTGADPVALLLDSTFPRALNVVFKQLSEKLDAVREVAGSVLLGLVEACQAQPLVRFPNYETVLVAIKSGMAPESDDYATINWANPTQVYPIVCQVLESQVFFEPVLSGLVLSVGGLSETTAKCSTKALLAFCGRALSATATSDNVSRLEQLASILVALLVANKKCDRVIVPTLKTAVAVLNEGVLDSLSPLFLAQFTNDLYAALAAEARGSTNVAKLCAIVDLLVRSLSLHLGHSRYLGLQTLLSMLTHKYPRVRKRKFNMRIIVYDRIYSMFHGDIFSLFSLARDLIVLLVQIARSTCTSSSFRMATPWLRMASSILSIPPLLLVVITRIPLTCARSSVLRRISSAHWRSCPRAPGMPATTIPGRSYSRPA